MTGAPVATRYSLEFIIRSLPADAREILEIGCGRGELASALIKQGFSVVGIDNSEECVAAAKAAGVDARLADWPAQLDRRFDAVLFTRSLHHMHGLDASLDAARDALCPRGRIIVEDFRAEGASERSNAWYSGLVRSLAASGAFRHGFDLDERLAAPFPDEHGHELHSSSAITTALGRLGTVEAEDSAYYFRYLEGHFRNAEAASELLDLERSLLADDRIDALGKRFVVKF